MAFLTARRDVSPTRTATVLYFRLLAPLLAVTTLWSTSLVCEPNYLLTLPLVGVALAGGVLYPYLPARLESMVRLLLTGVHLFSLAVVNILTALGLMKGDTVAFALLLLNGPVTVLAWSFLFTDQPRVGRLFRLLLSGLASALIAQWARPIGNQTELGIIAFVTCLVADQFGYNVWKLQQQVSLHERDARHDTLTGLPNRRAFDERTTELEQGGGVLAVIDIDHFKAVNDQHGHTAGDQVLREVADVLRTHLSGVTSAYRWGGEEFVVLLSGYDIRRARQLLEAVRQELRGRHFVHGQQVTLSIGLAAYTSPLEFTATFTQADQAVFQAKREGRDRIVQA